MTVNGWTEVARRLRGQTLRAPNLRPVHENWTSGENIKYRQLQPVVDRKLEEVIMDYVRLLQVKSMDFAYLTCW